MFRHLKYRVHVNGTWFEDILVDEHTFHRHGESVPEVVVTQLVSLLHMQDFAVEAVDAKGFQYFVNNELLLDGILHYRHQRFTIDNLMMYLTKIKPDLKVKVA